MRQVGTEKDLEAWRFLHGAQSAINACSKYFCKSLQRLAHGEGARLD